MWVTFYLLEKVARHRFDAPMAHLYSLNARSRGGKINKSTVSFVSYENIFIRRCFILLLLTFFNPQKSMITDRAASQ